MNQSLLIMADFVPSDLNIIQTIGLQDIDLEKLFNNSINSPLAVTYLYVHPNVERHFKELIAEIRIIKAAGGLVKNGDGDFLFIFRLGKWDLPKGKVEEDEKMRDAALREVQEECGIKVNYLGQKVSTTYHTYLLRGKFVLKQTNWYDMGVNKCPKLIPQLAEDITQAEWVEKNDFQKIINNSYPLIIDLIKDL